MSAGVVPAVRLTMTYSRITEHIPASATGSLKAKLDGPRSAMNSPWYQKNNGGLSARMEPSANIFGYSQLWKDL